MCNHDKELAFGPLLGHCSHLAKERMNARLAQYDITPVQTHVLLYLTRVGGQIPQRILTDALRVKPSTVNGILDRLEKKGLVVRSVNDNDARQKLIAITPKGAEQLECFSAQFQMVEQVILRNFSPDETALFLKFLERVLRNLEEDRTIC